MKKKKPWKPRTLRDAHGFIAGINSEDEIRITTFLNLEEARRLVKWLEAYILWRESK